METQPVLCAAAAPPATGRAAPAKPAGLACFPGHCRKGKGGTNGTERIVPQAVRQFPALFCHAGQGAAALSLDRGVSGGIGPHCQRECQHDRIQRRAVRRPGGPFRRRAALPVFYAAIAGDRHHFQPDKQPVPGADRPEPAADGVEKGRASAAAIL